MLSFIYRLVSEFEQEHGYKPNLLYVNEEHAERLTEGFDCQHDLHAIMGLLNMEIIIDKGVIHPHVAWMRMAQKRAV